jgi:DNA polymerase
VADLTSIESVGLAWLAGCDTILDIFHQGRDTYRTFAAESEHIAYDEVTKAQRTYAKPAVLGAGYRLSAHGLVAYAASMGVELEYEEAKRQIRLFRDLYHEIPHHWKQLENAAQSALMYPGQTFHAFAADRVISSNTSARGYTYHNYTYRDWPRTSYYYDGTFLFCQLPSGRHLCYFDPQLEEADIPSEDGSTFRVTQITYMGIDQKATGGNAWCRIPTHGGKLVENNTQALCRDVMWNGLEPAEADPGLEVVGDVYDEIPSLCNDSDTEALDRLTRYMTSLPPWLDNRFYLGADGYLAERYRK